MIANLLHTVAMIIYPFSSLMKRKLVSKIGINIGVGKESDIYICETPKSDTVDVKFARLRRTSFRTVKDNMTISK